MFAWPKRSRAFNNFGPFLSCFDQKKLIFSVNSTLEFLVCITAWRSKKLKLERSSSNQGMLKRYWLLFSLYSLLGLGLYIILCGIYWRASTIPPSPILFTFSKLQWPFWSFFKRSTIPGILRKRVLGFFLVLLYVLCQVLCQVECYFIIYLRKMLFLYIYIYIYIYIYMCVCVCVLKISKYYPLWKKFTSFFV